MTDDIVTRLREWDKDPATDSKYCSVCEGARWKGHQSWCLLANAADEIERLRKEVEQWKFLANEESSNQGF